MGVLIIIRDFFKYNYEELGENDRQYDDIDIENCCGVTAKYIPLPSDCGNPYIEALPLPRSNDELNLAATKELENYNHDEEIKKPVYQQILSILKLRELRFPLPMNFELEQNCYNVLVLSYRARKMFRDEDISLAYEASNKHQATDGILIGQDADAANAGITMLGYSGCGKSSALKTLFSNYPQFIIHEGQGLNRYPQIVYLVVQCPPHSNFRGLYKNIGRAIDRALGNVRPVYEKELDAGYRGNLSQFTDKVRALIEQFSIGIIIFDEIQNLDFNTSLENSFESILELINQTKVAFGVVGTEDAYRMLFAGNLRQSRRLGTEIHADKYCQDKKLFSIIVNKLFSYQWFDELVKPTNDIIDALYTCSHGIIDQLIGIYIFMNIDYVRAKKKAIIDSDYVYKTAARHYTGMQSIFSDKTFLDKESLLSKMRQKASDELNSILAEERSKSAEEATIKALTKEDSIKKQQFKEFTTNQILQHCQSFSKKEIEQAVNKFLLTERGKELLEENAQQEFTNQVYTKLMDKAKKANNANPERKMTEMKNFILSNG